MSKQSNTPVNDPSKIREILVKTIWFMKPYTVLIEVWENGELIFEWLALPEAIKDKQKLLNVITYLMGGGESKWIN